MAKTEPEPQLWDAPEALLEAETAGYSKGLKRRHVQMIAVGGAIGTGLFLGAGGRLNSAGPVLVVVYAICGLAVFLVLRALAEMVLHRPTSGSFVSYAREFMGEKGAFVAGWMYVLLWATVGIADITAVALYAKYWGIFEGVPQGVIALVALILVLVVNLVSAKLFGEMEFWGAVVKVGALVGFMLIGLFFLLTRQQIDGQQTGLSVIADNGGIMPHGLIAACVVVPGVIFAYSSLELVSIAAGETKNPKEIVPKATNTVIIRVAVFYCGSVLLLALLLPWSAYSADESPFVTFFAAIGIEGAASVMNFVVLTAALSSVNSGLYATGRILRTMSVGGHAPQFVGRLSRRKVPAGAIAFVAVAYFIGIFLNFVMPQDAFNLMVNLAALGMLSTWGFILISHAIYLKKLKAEGQERQSFRMPFAPYSNYIVVAFLVAVFLLMWEDGPIGRWTMFFTIPISLLLVGGWFAVRKRVHAITQSYSTQPAAQEAAEEPES